MSILFAGDLYYGYDFIANDIILMSEYISEVGCSTVINLEGAIVEDTSYQIKKRGEHLAQNKSVIEILKKLNVVGVSICNNHIFDFGTQGVISTETTLRKHKIKCCGIRLEAKKGLEPMLIEDDDFVYRIYAATDPYEESKCSFNGEVGCISISELLNYHIEKKCNNYINIAFLHTGFEYNTIPSIRTVKECRKLIDNGFDYVICSHPHLVQPYEIYKGRPIFYSLGNFYFSSFREEFQNKKIYAKSDGFCNEGLAIMLDGMKYKCIGIHYDNEKNLTFFSEKIPVEKKEIVCDYNYNRQYIANRNNHNPALTGNKLDSVKMNFLYLLYAIHGLYRKIKKKDG